MDKPMQKAIEEAAHQLFWTTGLLTRSLAYEMRDTWGHHSQFILLAILNRRVMTIGQLAKHQGVSAASMSNTISTFEERGWVTRKRDSEDKRVLHIHITEVGKDVFAQMQSETRATLAAKLERLTPEQLDTLTEGLAIVNDVLDEDFCLMAMNESLIKEHPSR